jgi:hypothetical protein
MTYLNTIQAHYIHADNDGYGRKFIEHVDKLKEDLASEMKYWDKNAANIAKLLDTVAKLASEVYEEGHDHYGVDYLSQHLSSEEKEFLIEIMQDSFVGNMFDVNTHMEKLEAKLKRFVRELEKEKK